MADISKELQNFRDAVYGEEVRGSMISLTEKVNKESTDAKTAAAKSASDAGAAASNASYAVSQANAAVQNANTAAQNIQTKADRGDFTGTIQIGEVTTGEPGSQASASNSGTGKDAVIDLTIPQGYKGVSMRMAGVWTAGTEYVNNTSYIDLVTYQGSMYGCKQTHTASEGIVPENEEYWQCLAEKGETGGIENIDTTPISFEEAAERENIESGEPLPTGLGKIKKWLSDFKQAAFMNVVNGVTQSEAGKAVLDAAVGRYLDQKKLDVSRLVANRNITEPGFAMDGKTLVEWLNELNGKTVNGCWNLKDLIQIQIHTDLNSLVNPGNYCCNSNADANTISNSPTKKAFTLRVELATGSGAYIRQILSDYYDSDTYVRNYRNDETGTVWSEWKKREWDGYVYPVDSFAPNGEPYNEENLKIFLHERMKTLVSTYQCGTRRKILPWSTSWANYTYISGEATLIPYDLYLTTCYDTKNFYVAYGRITDPTLSAFYRVGGM